MNTPLLISIVKIWFVYVIISISNSGCSHGSKNKNKESISKKFDSLIIEREYSSSHKILKEISYNYYASAYKTIRYFDTLGNIEYVGHLLGDNYVGPITFYKNKKIDGYNEYDFNDNCFYAIHYDTSGNTIYEGGMSISHFYRMLPKTDTIPLNYGFSLDLLYSEPEGYRNSLNIKFNGITPRYDIIKSHHLIYIWIESDVPAVKLLQVYSSLYNRSGKLMAKDSFTKTFYFKSAT